MFMRQLILISCLFVTLSQASFGIDIYRACRPDPIGLTAEEEARWHEQERLWREQQMARDRVLLAAIRAEPRIPDNTVGFYWLVGSLFFGVAVPIMFCLATGRSL